MPRQERVWDCEQYYSDRYQRSVSGLRDEEIRDALHVCNHAAPLCHYPWEAIKSPIEKNKFCDGSRCGGPRPHRNSDICTLERQGIIYAVAGHGDYVPFGLQRADHRLLLLWRDPAEDAVTFKYLSNLAL